MRTYHVAKTGSDRHDGSEQTPFLTIGRAAQTAMPGDTVIVHKGEYREWVKPVNSGISDAIRITYRAAEGEKVVIKGSEIVQNWEKMEENIWKAEVSNIIFGGFNPFAEKISGDWLVDPREYDVHLGAVYYNGQALFEAKNMEEVRNPKKREYSLLATWENRREEIDFPDHTLLTWYAEVKEESTILYANFGGHDPNAGLVEINVRKACFFPERTGVNYITVRGFEIAHAATQWAPPTAEQTGMIGPNWSKGWVIEENILHDSKCSAISLGKEAGTGQNDYTRTQKKPDYQYQMEAVFKGLSKGWSREQIGSHIVRNNTIYDCGQTGVVGHMGCIFSQIYGNEIYRIATRHEFWGHEIAGIKLHAAVDVQIHDNHIHHCSLGTWLDWQAQGVRVSRNIYDHNNRDFMIEVTHGPYLVDNNIFASNYNFTNAAQGGAYVNNLCCGLISHYPVLDRPTPYHMPHSTQVMGVIGVYGSDDRWYQNIFVGGKEERPYGTSTYDGAALSLEEFTKKIREYQGDDLRAFVETKQPAYIHRNLYLKGAKAFEKEDDAVCLTDWEPDVCVEMEDGETVLTITLPKEVENTQGNVALDSAMLGNPRITEAGYENPDGSPLVVDVDLQGREYGESVQAGPLQCLRAGKNVVKLGKYGIK
ncbi:MAG: right-handed parallel beta-helix repeat-containing protein [Lachnospiraceae bacterium]|nr:right-handed parallel beta-helix repeat-containing protein [Lachnospiraceae bacterium]